TSPISRVFFSSPLESHALDRNSHRRSQTPHRAVGKRDVPAMGASDVARDREPQPRAALVLIAGFVQAVERPEHIIAISGVDAGAVVIDDNRHELSLAGR